jgi:hypothetical protein
LFGVESSTALQLLAVLALEVEELAVGEGVVEVLNNAVVSTKARLIEVVPLLAFLDRFVLLVIVCVARLFPDSPKPCIL